jgi:hypothetical protein
MYNKIKEDEEIISKGAGNAKYVKDNKNISQTLNNTDNTVNCFQNELFKNVHDEESYNKNINLLNSCLSKSKPNTFDIVNNKNSLKIIYNIKNDVYFQKEFYNNILDTMEKTNQEIKNKKNIIKKIKAKMITKAKENKENKENKEILKEYETNIKSLETDIKNLESEYYSFKKEIITIYSNVVDDSKGKKNIHNVPNIDNNYKYIFNFFKKIINDKKPNILNNYINDSGIVEDVLNNKYIRNNEPWYTKITEQTFFTDKFNSLNEKIQKETKDTTICIYNGKINDTVTFDYGHLKYWHYYINSINEFQKIMNTTTYFNESKFNMNNNIEQIVEIAKVISIFITKVKEFLYELSTMVDIGKKICNNRLIEGKFINKSLVDIRDTIKKMGKTELSTENLVREALKQLGK